MEFQLELFKILKDDAVKVCCTQYVSKFGKLSSGHRTGKDHFSFIPILKKDSTKECSNYRTVGFISHTSKVMLKILQARLQHYVNQKIPNVHAGFRKGTGPEVKLPTFIASQRKQGNSRKTSTSALLTMLKPLTVWSTRNWKILREIGIPYLSPEKPVCRSRSNSQTLTWNNGLVQNWERSKTRLYIVSLFI